MFIAISGKFSNDHFDAAERVVDKLRAIVKSAGLADVESDLDGFVFFPVILSDEFAIQKQSYRSFSRKERAEFVNAEIDADEWSKADAHRRLQIMTKALKDAVRDTPQSRLSDDAKDTVISRLERAFNSGGC